MVATFAFYHLGFCHRKIIGSEDIIDSYAKEKLVKSPTSFADRGFEETILQPSADSAVGIANRHIVHIARYNHRSVV